MTLCILTLVASATYFSYTNKELTHETERENLFFLSKVWGLMKYYHPNTNGGGVDFDKELIELIPLIKSAKNINERDALIYDWVMGYGDFEILDEKNTIASDFSSLPLDSYLDFSWINDTQMTENLRIILKRVSIADRDNRFQTDQLPYMLSTDYYFNFDYEEHYAHMSYPDENYRLLSLFRFWNVFEYFSPNKDILDTPWDDTLFMMIPQFLEASDELEYQKALRSLAKLTDDGHGIVTGTQKLYQESIGSYRIPVDLAWHENRAVVTATRYRDQDLDAYLKVGDVIKAINGFPIDEALEGLKFYNAASHKGAEISFALRHCLTVKNEDVTMDITRYGENLSLEFVAYPLGELTQDNAQEKPSLYWLNEDTLYLDYNRITLEEFNGSKKEILGSKALIIDLRGYPKHEMIFHSISDFLFPEPTHFVNLHLVDPNYLGNLYTEPYSLGKFNLHHYKGEVISLVNMNTGSHTEFCAMAFRSAPKGIVIGSETIGQNGNVVRVPMVGEYAIYYSSLGVHNIDNSETQRIGILPDIEVIPTVESIANGEDLYLNAALEYLEKVLKYKVPVELIEGKEMVYLEKALINRPFDLSIDTENNTFTLRQAHQVWQFEIENQENFANSPTIIDGHLMVPKTFLEKELKMFLNFQSH